MVNKGLNIIIAAGLILLLSGCDAVVHLAYTVENQSENSVTLFVPDYPLDNTRSVYGQGKDTTIVLKPDEKIIVGYNSKVDFPWGTKNIYKASPGKCGLKRIENDTTNNLGCPKDDWEYRNRNSKLTIK